MAEEVYESDLINMVIGTHMSIAKGIVKTAENVVKMNADTMQIFSRNPRGSNYKDPTVKEAEEFQRIRRETGFGAILAHAPYTMNLASAKPEVYEFACTVIREDVTRMDRLGIENSGVSSGKPYRKLAQKQEFKISLRGLTRRLPEKRILRFCLRQ